MARITPREKGNNSIQAKTVEKNDAGPGVFRWWKAQSKRDMAAQILSTVEYLKTNQQYRHRQSAIYARLYGNMPIFNFAGSSLNRMSPASNLPIDRPTMNVIQSCIDTLVSRVTQAKPRPMFLTDDADYKERSLAEQLNQFSDGELYQVGMYELAPIMLRDASVWGTGCLKIFETPDHRVGMERVLQSDLYVDPNDAFYGDPRQMFQLKLVDKALLQEFFPEARSDIAKAEQGYPDNSADAVKTIADQIIIAEAWRLPSGKDSGDGRHAIVCTSGVILDEEYTKEDFPFVFMHYSPRLTGFWGQSLAEQLMGTQVEINKLLSTISKSINLVGVPRVFVDESSKVVKSHINNDIGSIVTYRGIKPSYEVAPCVPQELYAQLERLIQFAYQQSGISALAASSQKPAGLNSGEAIKSYDDLQTDRFAALERRYHDLFIDATYQIIDKARDIAEEQGSYQTVYPGKDGAYQIDLPQVKLLDNPFVIQCYDTSFLPRDPAGRKDAIVNLMQAGIYTQKEGRRLLDMPDLKKDELLANAAEERIFKILDEIIETGKYTPPDPFMDLDLAIEKTNQYYNLYLARGLEESKAQKLRDFFTQLMALKSQAMPQPMAPDPSQPQGVAPPRPTSDLISNVPQ